MRTPTPVLPLAEFRTQNGCALILGPVILAQRRVQLTLPRLERSHPDYIPLPNFAFMCAVVCADVISHSAGCGVW